MLSIMLSQFNVRIDDLNPARREVIRIMWYCVCEHTALPSRTEILSLRVLYRFCIPVLTGKRAADRKAADLPILEM